MADNTQTYNDRITSNPHVMVGKPVVKGTRIPVERVVAQQLRRNALPHPTYEVLA
jgi:uncharacterized protein (DUF433 family)